MNGLGECVIKVLIMQYVIMEMEKKKSKYCSNGRPIDIQGIA